VRRLPGRRVHRGLLPGRRPGDERSGRPRHRDGRPADDPDRPLSTAARTGDPAGHLLGGLLARAVSVREAFGDTPGAGLFPAEQRLVAGALPERRRAFTTARACARGALAGLQVEPRPILPGPGGAPCWPGGVVGSITHCRGYRAAAVGRLPGVLAIGIDAEPDAPLRPGVLRRLASPAEAEHVDRLGVEDPCVNWDRLLFSAKEAAFKTWFPFAGEWIGPDDVAVVLEPGGTFAASVRVEGAATAGRLGTELPGRWRARGGVLATAVVLHGMRSTIPRRRMRIAR